MIIERIIATVFTWMHYDEIRIYDSDKKRWWSILLSLTYLDVAVSALSSSGK